MCTYKFLSFSENLLKVLVNWRSTNFEQGFAFSGIRFYIYWQLFNSCRHTTCFFSYPWKHRKTCFCMCSGFLYVFRLSRKRSLAWNELSQLILAEEVFSGNVNALKLTNQGDVSNFSNLLIKALVESLQKLFLWVWC